MAAGKLARKLSRSGDQRSPGALRCLSRPAPPGGGLLRGYDPGICPAGLRIGPGHTVVFLEAPLGTVAAPDGAMVWPGFGLCDHQETSQERRLGPCIHRLLSSLL